jgi:hypothetical protein
MRIALVGAVHGVHVAGAFATQVPLLQLVPDGHAVPHVPQLPLSLNRFTQAVPQRISPLGQTHIPLTQVCAAAHVLPQAPQLFTSLNRLTQVVPQRDSPVPHEQLPPTQAVVGEAHFRPQAPQLAGSVLRSTQLDPQAVRVPEQENVQAPFEHQGVPASAAQRRLQAPQLFTSDWTSTQRPAQSRQPVGHAQAPRVQIWFEPDEQARPHAPQLEPSVCVLTQLVPQKVCPLGQLQAPFTQVCVATQALPHVPQFRLSVVTSTQLVPQSAWAAAHGGSHSPWRQVLPPVQKWPQ